jgi:hypothetical protein
MLGPARVVNEITPPFQNSTAKEKESYMTTRNSIIPRLAAASMAGLLVAGGAAPALACTVTGNGSTAFATIQAAVNAGAIVINFTGTDCGPFVFIFHPVTLAGTGATPADNVITQGITVQGAQRVFIINAQIGGDTSNPDNSGVNILEGASVRVLNSNIESTVQGVSVVRGSVAFIRNSAIQGRAPSTFNDVSNIFAGDHSLIRLENTTVTMNESNNLVGPLTVFRNSELLLRGGNSITNTGSLQAIQVGNNSILRQDDPGVDATPPVDGTPDAINGGIMIGSKSVADVRDLTIAGDVVVDLDSVFSVGATDFGGEPEDIVITGNITASRQSIIAFESPLPTVNGNITCKDTQSHLSGKAVFNGTVNCLGFTPLSNQGNQP